jgi:hypothetical protein
MGTDVASVVAASVGLAVGAASVGLAVGAASVGLAVGAAAVVGEADGGVGEAALGC